MPTPPARLIVAPLDSPALDAAVAAILARPHPAILDSSAVGSRDGRYTVLAAEPAAMRAWTHGLDGSAFDGLAEWIAQTPRVEDDEAAPGLAYVGGWIGYLGYEAGRWIERLPARTGTHAHVPTAWFGLYDTLAVYDHAAGQCMLVAVEWPASSRLADRPPAADRIRSLQAVIASKVADYGARGPAASPRVRTDFTPGRYRRAVARAIDYIAAGDVFQVNLAQRMIVETAASPADVFARLRRDNPSAFGAFLRPADAAIVSASPELFLRLRGNDVVTRPIKGTRPRSSDPAVDASYRHELVDSPKDAAELAMIIDLERNDLGRVCEYGSVRVAEARVIERHPTVYHLVGTITGRLRTELGAVDLLRATFPGGSITGAPKVRAMEIIDELEPVPRGVYCGSIGMIGLDGSATFNIAIRTITMVGGIAEVYAGGGIVADSDPHAEYEETLDKAAALLAALGVSREQTACFRRDA